MTAKYKKQDLWILIAVVVGLIIKFAVPPANGLTEQGVTLLSLFIPTILLWIFVGNGWPSIVASILFGIFGIFPAASVLQMTIGSSIPITIVAFGFVNLAMQRSGLLDRIAKSLVSAKFCAGKPWVFLATYMTGVMVVSIFFSQIMNMLIFTAISLQLANLMGYKPGEKFHTALFLVPLWFGCVGESVYPLGKSIGMTAIGILEGFGFTFELGKHIMVSLPWYILYLIVGFLIIRFVLRPDVSKFQNYDPEVFRKELRNKKMSQGEIACIIGYIVLLVIWTLPNFNLGAFSTWLGGFGTQLAPFIFAIVFSIVRFDGRKLIEISEDWGQVPWGVAFFCGTVLCFSAAMGGEAFGVGAFLTNLMSPLIETGSGFTILLVSMLVAGLLTNFISNLVTQSVMLTVFIPVLAAMGAKTGISPAALATCSIICANIAYLTPAATPMAAVVIGKEISVKDALIPSVLQIFIGCFLAIIMTAVIF